jgi:HEAT repeat protein
MSEVPAEVSALLDSLDRSDKRAMRAAVDSLIATAAQSPELRETLTGLLLDGSRNNLWPIAYILGKLPAPPPVALGVLLNTLGAGDPDIRWACALLLVEVGKSNPETISRLLDLLKTGNPNQRRMAVYCIRDLSLKDTASLRAIEAALDDPDPLVRVAAATSLKRRPDLGAEGSDLLLEIFLNDPDPRVRHSAALTLAQVGAASEKFVAALNEATRSNDPNAKKVADSALALLQKKRSAPPEQ